MQNASMAQGIKSFARQPRNGTNMLQQEKGRLTEELQQQKEELETEKEQNKEDKETMEQHYQVDEKKHKGEKKVLQSISRVKSRNVSLEKIR